MRDLQPELHGLQRRVQHLTAQQGGERRVQLSLRLRLVDGAQGGGCLTGQIGVDAGEEIGHPRRSARAEALLRAGASASLHGTL